MFDHFQKSYSRDDFPWADLLKAANVSLREVVSVFDLWSHVRQEGARLYFRCPFHLSSVSAVLVMDLACEQYSCVLCTKDPKDVVDFVHRILPVQRVGAEMWLLQFVASERDRVMQEFRHLIYWLNDCGAEAFVRA